MSWPARTAHVLRGLAHVAESPSQRQDYVAAQRVVPRLGMIVRRIRYGQVLRLVQQVVCLQSQCKPVLEQKLGNLDIENILILLRSRVAPVRNCSDM